MVTMAMDLPWGSPRPGRELKTYPRADATMHTGLSILSPGGWETSAGLLGGCLTHGAGAGAADAGPWQTWADLPPPAGPPLPGFGGSRFAPIYFLQLAQAAHISFRKGPSIPRFRVQLLQILALVFALRLFPQKEEIGDVKCINPSTASERAGSRPVPSPARAVGCLAV